MSLLNKSEVKKLALSLAQRRAHKLTRVSKEFLEDMDVKLRYMIQKHIEGLPSLGKTIFGVMLCLGLYSCQPAFGATASWYDSASVKREGTCHAEKCYTASGKEIHQLERDGVLFAASNDFKLGTRVRVTNPASGKSTVVTILDRGGFGRYGRSIDLCSRAFQKLSPLSKGLIHVIVKVEP